MANNSPDSTYTHVAIRMGGLVVEIGTETAYPDMVSDITNRVLNTFQESVKTAKENGIDITEQTLYVWESGGYSPDLKDLPSLCKTFKVNAGYFFNRKAKQSV